MSNKNRSVIHPSNTLNVTVELYSLKHSNFNEESKWSISAFSLNFSWVHSFSNSSWLYYGAKLTYFDICLVIPYVLYLVYVCSVISYILRSRMTLTFLSQNFTLLDLNISKSLWCLKHKQAWKKINNSPKINQKFSNPCFLISFVAVLLKERISKCYLNCHSLLKYLHYELNLPISSVQSLSHVRLVATPWTAAYQASLSITISWSSLRLTSIESVMPSNHLILCCPLLLLPPIPPSIRVFSNPSHEVAKVLEFQL